MRTVNVLGLDPGFASCGYAEVTYSLQKGYTVVRMGTIRTAKSKGRAKKTTVDNSRRARELSCILSSLIAGADIVCAESLSVPFVPGRGGAGKVAAVKSALQIATCWGLIVAHCQLNRRELREATPQVIKKHVTGKANASKDEVRASLAGVFGRKQLEDVVRDTPNSQHVHAYDALAAAIACIQPTELQQLGK